jgi:hypothetical protein
MTISISKRNQARARAARAKAVQAERPDRPRPPAASTKQSRSGPQMSEPVGYTNIAKAM